MRTVVGFDIGHSALKICGTSSTGDQFHFMEPSVVCPAFHISDEAESRRAAVETVVVRNKPYFFGETARTQAGSGVSGLSEDWIDTPEHIALILGAVKKIVGITGKNEPIDIVMGLPTHLFSRQKERLETLVRDCVKDAATVKIVPQSLAPYYGLMIDENGLPSRDHDKDVESWGVVEVGYFTSDFMMAKRGRWVEGGSNQDICPGVRAAAENLIRLVNQNHSITIDILDAEEALLNKYVKHFGKKVKVEREVDESIEVVVSAVVDMSVRLLESSARNLDGILVAGGGAHLVFSALMNRWPHAILAENPRFAVAEGMRRLGVTMALSENVE